jgi:competence protein ComEA
MSEQPLDFSKRSRRAIILFLIAFIVVALIPRMYYLMVEPSPIQFTQTDFEKNSFAPKKFNKSWSKTYSKKERRFKTPPSKFDPNTYSPSDWMNLGLSQKQADLIIRFGKRGFYSHDDLRKVFVISDAFFSVIKDSLVYPTKAVKEYKTDAFKENLPMLVDLNTASLEELMNIKGIGSFFAKNVINYRTKLGGYHHKEQLKEVWKMDDEHYAILEKAVSIDQKAIRSININRASVEELKSHPYFTWNVANSIVKLRSQIGAFSSVEDLKKSKLIDEALFLKLKPYVTVED